MIRIFRQRTMAGMVVFDGPKHPNCSLSFVVVVSIHSSPIAFPPRHAAPSYSVIDHAFSDIATSCSARRCVSAFSALPAMR